MPHFRGKMPNDDSSSLGSDDNDTGLCANCCSDPRGFLSFSASKCTRCGARMATVNLVNYTKKAARTVAGVLTSKEPLRSSGVHTLAVANLPQPLWFSSRWQGVVRSAGRGGWVRAVLGGSAFGAGVRVGKGSSSSRSSPFGVTRALTHACVSACVFEAPILGKVGAIAPEPFLAS